MRYTALLIGGSKDGEEIPLDRVNRDFLDFDGEVYTKIGFWNRPTRNHWKLRYDCLDLD